MFCGCPPNTLKYDWGGVFSLAKWRKVDLPQIQLVFEMAAQEPFFAGMGELFKQNHTDGFFYSVLRGGPIVYIVGIIVGIHTDVPKFRLDLGTALTRMMHTIMSISSSVY